MSDAKRTEALRQAQGNSSAGLHEWVADLVGTASGPLLDVGCGAGGLARVLAGRGFRELQGCDGWDYAKELAAVGAGFQLADLNRPLPYADRSFAAVLAVELVEHLENPRALLREIHRVLRPEGLAIVTTPNLESWTSLLSLGLRGYPSAFSDASYPAHITPILEIDLRRMFREAGFAEPRAAWSGSGRIPGTPWHWQPFGSRFGGKRLSDNFAVIARRGS